MNISRSCVRFSVSRVKYEIPTLFVDLLANHSNMLQSMRDQIYEYKTTQRVDHSTYPCQCTQSSYDANLRRAWAGQSARFWVSSQLYVLAYKKNTVNRKIIRYNTHVLTLLPLFPSGRFLTTWLLKVSKAVHLDLRLTHTPPSYHRRILLPPPPQYVPCQHPCPHQKNLITPH